MQPLFLDIETTGLSPFDSDISLIQIMPSAENPMLIQDINNIQMFKPVIESNLVIGHNLKFDTKFLKYHCGLNINHIYDTYLAELVISGGLQAGRRGAKLSDLASKYAGVELDKSEQTGFKPDQALTQSQIEYACMDVQVLPAIYKAQQEIIQDQGLQDTIDIEMACLPATVWLELSGIPFDLDGLEKIKQKTIDNIEMLSVEIKEMLKPGNRQKQQNIYGNGLFDINLGSPSQLLKAMQNIGIDIHDTKDETLSDITHPIGQFIKEYRAEEKLLSGFINKIPGHINPLTKRIHGSFNQFGAHSGRFTSSRPNLQQQPHSLEWRSLFKSNNGNSIITADYSQIELRILAEVSQDKEFIKAFNEGADLHSLTASKVLNIPIEGVTKEQRTTAKTVNFGISYGMWTDGLIRRMKQNGVELTQDEAKDIIDGFYKSYRGVGKYLWDISKQGLSNLELRNIANRQIKLTPPESSREEGSIKRKSKNLPIQSVGADILKTAMASLHKELADKDVKLINCVHDELVFEAPKDKARAVAEIVEREMIAAGMKYIKSVPVLVDVTVGEAWEK
ncbi:MAG: hypothetical protein KAQ85_00400 [Thermodesulfovibrionia bacterium]|nr:hypothetical protein [Thermodesulfovibrionia bacterium]